MDQWDWLTILWTAIALMGAHFSFRNINEGRADLRALDRIKPHAKTSRSKQLEWQVQHVAANGNIRRDIIRATIQILSILIGIGAFFFGDTDGVAILVPIVLIFNSALLTVSASFDYHDRRTLLKAGILLS